MPSSEAKTTGKTEATPAPRFLPLRTVSVEAALEGPPRHERRFGVVANISETGACVILNRGVEVQSSIELRVAVAGRQAPMTVRARVVWCAERLEPIKEIVGYLVGVAFVDAPANVKSLIESGIFQPVP